MFLPPSWPPLPSLFALDASTTPRALPLELYPPILFRSSATTRVRSPWHRCVPHFPRLPAFVLFPRLCLAFSNKSLVPFRRLPGGWSYLSTSSGSKTFPTDTLSATTFSSCAYYCIYEPAIRFIMIVRHGRERSVNALALTFPFPSFHRRILRFPVRTFISLPLFSPPYLGLRLVFLPLGSFPRSRLVFPALGVLSYTALYLPYPFSSISGPFYVCPLLIDVGLCPVRGGGGAISSSLRRCPHRVVRRDFQLGESFLLASPVRNPHCLSSCLWGSALRLDSPVSTPTLPCARLSGCCAAPSLANLAVKSHGETAVLMEGFHGGGVVASGVGCARSQPLSCSPSSYLRQFLPLRIVSPVALRPHCLDEAVRVSCLLRRALRSPPQTNRSYCSRSSYSGKCSPTHAQRSFFLVFFFCLCIVRVLRAQAVVGDGDNTGQFVHLWWCHLEGAVDEAG